MESHTDSVHRPDKDARVPEIVAFGQETFGRLEVWFFLETLHLYYFGGSESEVVWVDSDVAIARFGTGRFDADSEQGLVVVWVFDEIHTEADDALEFDLVGDEMVGGSDNDRCIIAKSGNVMHGIGDTRGGIAAHGFAEDLFGTKFGEMLEDHIAISSIGDDDKILRRDDRKEAFESAANKTLASTQNIKELFGIIVLA